MISFSEAPEEVVIISTMQCFPALRSLSFAGPDRALSLGTLTKIEKIDTSTCDHIQVRFFAESILAAKLPNLFELRLSIFSERRDEIIRLPSFREQVSLRQLIIEMEEEDDPPNGTIVIVDDLPESLEHLGMSRCVIGEDAHFRGRELRVLDLDVSRGLVSSFAKLRPNRPLEQFSFRGISEAGHMPGPIDWSTVNHFLDTSERISLNFDFGYPDFAGLVFGPAAFSRANYIGLEQAIVLEKFMREVTHRIPLRLQLTEFAIECTEPYAPLNFEIREDLARGWAASIKTLNIFADEPGNIVVRHPSLESLEVFADYSRISIAVLNPNLKTLRINAR
jgi:hypothetical protein